LKNKKNLIIIFALAFIFATFLCLYSQRLLNNNSNVTRVFRPKITCDSNNTFLQNNSCKYCEIDADFNNNPEEIINKKPEGDILLPPKQPQITPTPENN
jgi:hypothetical protein